MQKLGRGLLAILVASALVLVGCGDDDDLDAVPSSDEDGDGGGSSDDGGDDDVDLGDLSGDCLRAAQAMGAVIAIAFGGGDTDIDEAREQLEELADNAPDELEDDFDTVAEYYEAYAEALEDAGYDPEDPPSSAAEQQRMAAALGEALEELDDEEFQEASDNVSEWLDEECGQD
jgi:hypothetical protein